MSFNHDKNHSEITKGATIEELKAEIERLKLLLVTETDSGFKKQVHIDRLKVDLAALRDQLRWVPITEGLPELNQWLEVCVEEHRRPKYAPPVVIIFYGAETDLIGIWTYYRIITPPSKEVGE